MAEENRWAGARAISRSQRVAYTDTLKKHHVTGPGYMHCTEAVYTKLLGGRSRQIRVARGLEPMANIRDNLSVAELSFVMAAEALGRRTDRARNSDRQRRMCRCQRHKCISYPWRY
jgi:hypothetical protein